MLNVKTVKSIVTQVLLLVLLLAIRFKSSVGIELILAVLFAKVLLSVLTVVSQVLLTSLLAILSVCQTHGL